MRDDGRLWTLGALGLVAVASAVRRGSRQRVERTVTRDGFPWPDHVEAFHATPFVREILHQGFKTREMGAPQMLGGAWTKSVSLTLSEKRAASIALGLSTLIRGANGLMGCEDLLHRLLFEVPGAFPLAVTSGSNLQDILFYAFPGEYHDITLSEVGAVLSPFLRKLDEGWTSDRSPYNRQEQRQWRPPPGSIRVFRTEDGTSERWLFPPGTVPAQGYIMDAKRAFFELYRGVLSFCRDQCFNPIFFTSDLEPFVGRDPDDVGVLVCTVSIPRVCADEPGARRLGYLSQHHRGLLIGDTLRNLHYDCTHALGARPGDDYALARRDKPLIDHWSAYEWRRFSEETGWRVVDEGSRTPDATMLYEDREEELVVYDPRQVHVQRVLTMADLRHRFDLGDRVTFPHFDPRNEPLSFVGNSVW